MILTSVQKYHHMMSKIKNW